MNPGRHRRVRGASLLEAISATLILTVGIMGMMKMWVFADNLTILTDKLGIAYSLGRRAIEKTKETGFISTADGTTVLYYDLDMGQESATQQSYHRYSVTTVITSNRLDTDPSTGAVTISNWALRSVAVTVTRLSTNTVIFQTGTHLIRGGL